MEQNADVGTSIMPTVDNKRKSGNGLKITTAIACIVAVCGIGFGIYGMVQSLQKDNQIADLKSQIEKNNQEISEFYYIQYTSGGGFGTMAETSSKTIIIGTEGKVKFTNDYEETIYSIFCSACSAGRTGCGGAGQFEHIAAQYKLSCRFG